MLALRLTCFRASGCYRRVYDLGVSKCHDFGLRNENFVADGTMLALRLTCFRASGCYCRVYDLGVSKCHDFGLRNKNFVADGAMLAFCLTCFCASGCYCRVYNLGVSERRLNFGITYRTGLCLRTGRRCTRGVTKRRSYHCITYRAGLCLRTGRCCPRGVTKCGSYHCITYRTVLCSCTGCRLTGRMSLRGYIFRLCFAAIRTGSRLFTCDSTSGLLRGCPLTDVLVLLTRSKHKTEHCRKSQRE